MAARVNWGLQLANLNRVCRAGGRGEPHGDGAGGPREAAAAGAGQCACAHRPRWLEPHGVRRSAARLISSLQCFTPWSFLYNIFAP